MAAIPADLSPSSTAAVSSTATRATSASASCGGQSRGPTGRRTVAGTAICGGSRRGGARSDAYRGRGTRRKGPGWPGRGLRAAGRANFEFKDKVPRSTGCEIPTSLFPCFLVSCRVCCGQAGYAPSRAVWLNPFPPPPLRSPTATMVVVVQFPVAVVPINWCRRLSNALQNS